MFDFGCKDIYCYNVNFLKNIKTALFSRTMQKILIIGTNEKKQNKLAAANSNLSSKQLISLPIYNLYLHEGAHFLCEHHSYLVVAVPDRYNHLLPYTS